VELHGGYDYIKEYKVSKWYRDAKILELYEGT
jgi:alkylation response protein AidB-like acyl-CoA dehydrogenase